MLTDSGTTYGDQNTSLSQDIDLEPGSQALDTSQQYTQSQASQGSQALSQDKGYSESISSKTGEMHTFLEKRFEKKPEIRYWSLLANVP